MLHGQRPNFVPGRLVIVYTSRAWSRDEYIRKTHLRHDDSLLVEDLYKSLCILLCITQSISRWNNSNFMTLIQHCNTGEMYAVGAEMLELA